MSEGISVTGLAAISCLGKTLAEHQAAMDAGRHGLRLLGELDETPPSFANLHGGWIEPRSLLAGKRYAPGSNLALALARAAVADAGWNATDLRGAWLIVGSSRGNLAGWLTPWPGRRLHRLMQASNSMHSELASAVSIELGIRGPCQVISNGCSSGLDAIGLAQMAMGSNMAPRALVLALDLPLVEPLLSSFARSGLLSTNGVNDPYSDATTGFLPAEGGAALALERGSPQDAYGELLAFAANSDAHDPLALPPDGRGVVECLRAALDAVPAGIDRRVAAVCPHASGTVMHGRAESCALESVFGSHQPISLHLIKPFTGHTLGASGALDAALLLHYMRQELLPPNLPGLAGASGSFALSERPGSLANGLVVKLSAGMGGRNAALVLRRIIR